MMSFLYVLGSFVLLGVIGLAVSFYLYRRGAIGRKRSVRIRSFRTLAFETSAEDESEYYPSMGVASTESDATSRFARTSLMVVLLGLLIIVALVASFVGAVVH